MFGEITKYIDVIMHFIRIVIAQRANLLKNALDNI